ncbi:hypothetical protein Bca4012_045048 [Brassica carinata]|uniref:Uncharacterized protein n=1 Tax=Brassica oleracea TaxID=3712 RepID=A0A3P6EN19_BRAOL|nr:unnamed protein product [Brassica oleracea]
MEPMVKKLKQKLRFGSSRNMEDKWFLENGSILLKELIADCNGKSVPIRNFSSYQILQATNNFHFSCLVTNERSHNWYKGIIKTSLTLSKDSRSIRLQETEWARFTMTLSCLLR